MNYVIENDKIKVEISDKGAELQSIYGKKSDYEYLWQANVEGLWKSRATIIFPNCGRLFGGKYTYNGKEYELPCHGFAKLMTFKVAKKEQTKIVFELTDSQESLKIYPFSFNLKIAYTLSGASVRTEFIVENTGKGDLPFSVGGHPGFSLPFEKDLEFTDHYVEFEKAKKRARVDMSKNCLFLESESAYSLEQDKIIRLKHEIFSDDAIFLSDNDGSVTLKSDKSNKFVKVSYAGATHVGFWQTYGENTNFVCIEPWHGVPATEGKEDDFATKNGFIHLESSKKYNYYFDITVSE